VFAKQRMTWMTQRAVHVSLLKDKVVRRQTFLQLLRNFSTSHHASYHLAWEQFVPESWNLASISLFLMNLTRSRLRSSPRPAHRRPRSAREFCWWLSMPISFGMMGSSHLCSLITGGVANVVPLHVDIPRTGGRGFDLPFEDSLQKYLKFPYECFLSVVLPFGDYCCKLCPSNNPRRNTRITSPE
jgi:hypothetical protein